MTFKFKTRQCLTDAVDADGCVTMKACPVTIAVRRIGYRSEGGLNYSAFTWRQMRIVL